MRTTIAIDDRLLEAAKRIAQQRGITLGGVIEEALRRDLADRSTPSPGPPVPIFRGGSGLKPGVDVSSTRAIFDALIVKFSKYQVP